MSAPNPLRVGSMERVFVEAQDYSGDDFNVKITVKNFPAKDQELPSTSVSLNLVNKYQALIDVTVSLYICFLTEMTCTVASESIHTPCPFPHFVVLQSELKLIIF